MKLRKAKRFNTVESYAACVCLFGSCSCNCSSYCDCSSNPSLDNARKLGDTDTKGQSVFNINYYSYNNVSG